MLIDDKSRYITHENNDEERKAAANELGECLKSAMADCYANNTLTKEAYISNIQNYISGAAHQLTFEPDMEVKLVDQYGRPWSEMISNKQGIFTTNTLNMGWNSPIPFHSNVLLKSGITTVEEEQLSESERQERYSAIVEYGKTAEDLSDFKNYVEGHGSWLTQEEKDALYDWWNEVHPKTGWWECLLGFFPFFLTGCAKEEPPAPELKSLTSETATQSSTEPPTEPPTEPQGRITSQMMKDFGWPLSDEELKRLNAILEKYGITDMKSIRLFMATCAHESGKGTSKIENGSEDYFIDNGYTGNTRGAGYIQLTGKEIHKKFLKTIPDSFSGADTATYIAENYPWEAAAWFWTSKAAKAIGKEPQISLNKYVLKYGDSKGVYLMTQYAVNGWTGAPKQDISEKIRDGKIKWEVKDGKVYVGGEEKGKAPNGWDSQENDYNRENTYNEAISSFK